MINSILEIGVKESESLKEVKIKKLFNGLTFIGIFISIFHFFNFFQHDVLAGVLHLFWGVICILAYGSILSQCILQQKSWFRLELLF